MSTVVKKVMIGLGYTLAVAVILAATLVSLTRMLTPYLNSHRGDFEKWASEEMHAPISIENVHITWYYGQPILTFENVAILEQGTHKSNFNIQQIKVNLQILPSLLHWQPMAKYIKLSGADLVLREQKDGQLSVEGAHRLAVIDRFAGNGVQANAAVTWILSQPRLSLEQVTIKYIPLNDIEKLFSINKLSLANNNITHELSGDVTLNQKIPLDVQLRIQVLGDVTDLSKLTVHGYFYLEGVSLTQWLKQNKWQNLQLMQGIGSARIWVDWDKNTLQDVTSELQIYDLEIKSLLTNKLLTISRLNGKFGWKREGDKHIISGEDILIDFPERLWPTTGFALTLQSASDGSFGLEALKVDYLNAADTVDLALASGFVPEKTGQWLRQLGLDGDLTALTIQFVNPLFNINSDTPILNNTLSVNFSKLSFNAWKPLPKVENLTGSLQWNGSEGSFNFNSQKLTVDLNTLFENPLFFDHLKGELQFKHDANTGWILRANNINAVNADLASNTNFTLSLPEKDSPIIDMKSDFSMTNITPITKYFPTKIMDAPLARWLQNTFYGGSISNGQFVLQGRLSDFPFDHNNGKFLVSADINDLDFEYAPKWPGIKHLDGKLTFSGHAMTVEVNSGQMINVPLKKVYAEIPYIGADQPQILNLRSVIDTDLLNAMEYVQHSPLQKKFGKDMSAVTFSGPVQLDLALSIPLKTPENTLVTGNMQIPNAELTLPAWNVKLEKLNGILRFTADTIKANDLKAQFLGQPIALTVASEPVSNTSSMVVVKFNSQLSKAMLVNGFKLPDTTLYQGAITYSAQLHLTSDEQSQPSQLIIASDLKGLQINLPDIYGKKADEMRASQLVIDLGKQDEGIGIRAVYGNLISAAVSLKSDHGQTQFYSGELRLGTGLAAYQSKPGLLISGQFNQWDLATWQQYFSELSAQNKWNASTASRINLAILRGVDLSAQQFSAYGVQLHNARIQAMQSQDGWSVNVNSTEMAGQVDVPNNLKKVVQMHFQHLYFMPFETKGEALDPKTLPPISFTGNDVRYKEIAFGNVTLNTVPTKSGLLIQTLQAGSGAYHFNAKGEWTSRKTISATVLDGELETKDVGKLLSSWGLKTSNLVESGGTAQFHLSWIGTPYSPELNSIIGNVSLKLTAGRIIDLSNSTDAKMGIGKMLNIFNLSNIPRRLSLNFKDFENGYSFDSMQGHFTLRDGSLFTQDTVFDGPIARIEIGGRIGYAAKDYDVKFSVTPYGMTSSLPIVATVVGGPVAGAATWLVDKVVGGAVSNVITHHYTVRGPWSQPEWSEK